MKTGNEPEGIGLSASGNLQHRYNHAFWPFLTRIQIDWRANRRDHRHNDVGEFSLYLIQAQRRNQIPPLLTHPSPTFDDCFYLFYIN